MQQLIEMSTHSEMTIRRQAVSDLAIHPTQEAVSALVRALHDPCRPVADRAVHSLIRIGGEMVAQAILPLINHEQIHLRSLALEVAVGLGPTAGPVLAELMNSSDRELRKSAAEVLCLSGYRQAEKFLRPSLTDPDPVVRQAVIAALTGLHCVEAVDEMIGLLAVETEEWVLFALASAIGQMGDGAQVERALALPHMSESVREFIRSEFGSRGAA